jgi:hypothetical protein
MLSEECRPCGTRSCFLIFPGTAVPGFHLPPLQGWGLNTSVAAFFGRGCIALAGGRAGTPSRQPAGRRRYSRCGLRATISSMYHYDPQTALEELNEDATLPNPVHVRDMMLRKHLSADKSLELNRLFLEYQKFFGEAQKLGKEILRQLAG